MAKLIRKTSRKRGLAPGTLVHIGDEKTLPVKISLLDYDETNLEEKQLGKIEDSFPFKDKPSVTWINIDGIHQLEIIEKIGVAFNLHPLIQEDIVNSEQRPKMDDLSTYIFVVLKMLDYDEKSNEIKSEQVSLVLGSNFLISFQEKEGDVFDQVRDRLRKSKGRIRKSGADYLAYTLIDAIIDNYYVILEKLGDKIEGMEDELVGRPNQSTLGAIHNIKRNLILLRKSVWPLRELISGLERSESPLIAKSTGIFLKDVYDHTIQVIDTVETFRDMVSGMLDIYLSSVSNKMNEVMKTLTIIATIFIPLTFIVGIYGMNFKYLPETQWSWGYFGVWGVMLIVAGAMVIYIKRKKWL